jgi:hypothetical protein
VGRDARARAGCVLKLLTLGRGEIERCCQQVDGDRPRMAASAVFEGRDGLSAEARGLGKSLLGEAGAGAEVTEELGDGEWSGHDDLGSRLQGRMPFATKIIG